MFKISIRKALSKDLESIVLFEAENNSGLWKESAFQSAIEASSTPSTTQTTSQQIYIIQKQSDGEILAYLVGMVALDEATLMHIVVSRQYRQQGQAKQLYQHWLDEIKLQHTIERVWLEVRLSNIAAQSLYKKLGFEEISVRKAYYKDPREDAVVMRMLVTNK